jgi:hypothetical protein
MTKRIERFRLQNVASLTSGRKGAVRALVRAAMPAARPRVASSAGITAPQPGGNLIGNAQAARRAARRRPVAMAGK